MPEPSADDKAALAQCVLGIVARLRRRISHDETSTLFALTGEHYSQHETIRKCDVERSAVYVQDVYDILSQTKQIEDVAWRVYGFDEGGKQYVWQTIGRHPLAYPGALSDDTDANRLMEMSTEAVIGESIDRQKTGRCIKVKSHYADRHLEVISHYLSVSPNSLRIPFLNRHVVGKGLHSLGQDILSYAVGVVVGRWDLQAKVSTADLTFDSVFQAPFAMPPASLIFDHDLQRGSRVVLNIAPLWELVPWKEAKNYWEELLEGKYEWSSMGKLLRKKGLVK